MTWRTFFSPNFDSYVLFANDALGHMYAYSQRGCFSKEAGGELFARVIDGHRMVIVHASGPHPQDQRSRHSFVPDERAGAKERLRNYELGLHAVGLWHTHPEHVPVPSGRDRCTTEEYLSAFNGERDRYLMAIIGNRGVRAR
ncbi:Mov34/MPN/PAD-1 family protein [Bordetella bronchialis]|uniref:Mov34/MPN/PAD-1 family protein n=1 Tax=Bordetella bronchialis TaxID=463025 RepID=UPI003D0455C9